MHDELIFSSEEWAVYRESVRAFISASVQSGEANWADRHCVDRAIWQEAGRLGYLLADIPECYGGGGGHFAHMAVMWEALVEAGDSAFGVHVHAVVAQYILNYGTEAQRGHYLPLMASGERIAAIALTEPGAGSDLQGMSVSARRVDGGYVLNGNKVFVTNGAQADVFLVAARTSAGPGPAGISLFLVDACTHGAIPRGRQIELIGRQAQDVCDVFFSDYLIPVDALLGEVEGKGFLQLNRELPYERLMIGVQAVAAMDKAIQLTTDYVNQRKINGKTLFDFQNSRFKLAEAKTKATVSRVFLNWCIDQLLAVELTADMAAMAKLFLTESQCEVADICVQLFGGYGYARENEVARIYTDARVQRIYGGANEIMKEIIAHSL